VNDLTPRAAAKRQQIRDAATQLFLENGFSATSMDGITSAAGVSKQTLYVYYASKEDLLIDVLRNQISATVDNRWPSIDQPDVITSRDHLSDWLEVAAHQIVTSLMQPKYLALVRIIVAESPRIPSLGRLFQETVPQRVLANVEQVLLNAREGGIVDIDDTDVAARMLVGSLLTWVLIDGLLVTDQEPVKPDDASIARTISLFMRSITPPSFD
jgi:TetR/AcrR family transcriptional regulator, mexJK operon transcriptional repressor